MLNSIKFKKSEVFNLKLKNVKLKICSLFLAVIFLVTATPVLAVNPTIKKTGGSPDHAAGTYRVMGDKGCVTFSVSLGHTTSSGRGVCRYYNIGLFAKGSFATNVSESQVEGRIIGYYLSLESPKEKCDRERKEEETARRREEESSPDSDESRDLGPTIGDMMSEACFHGDFDKVKLLIESGVNPDEQIRDGCTPLCLTAQFGYEACVRLLLEKGAEPNKMDSFGSTPLCRAADEGNEACLRLLLEKGADLTIAKRTNGKTPLYLAAEKGSDACVRLLLEKGADPNIADTDGCTPLVAAVYGTETHPERDYYGCVELLLEKGADPNHRVIGYTPRNLCKDPKIDALLKAHGGEKPGFFKRMAKGFVNQFTDPHN